MASVIYLVTNTVNGKKYVGFASDLVSRRNIHHCEAFTRNSQFLLHKALRKHGKDAFTWEVLESGEDHEHLLKEREPHHIRECDSHYLTGHGYNMTSGGDGILGFRFSDRQKAKLSRSHIGYVMPQSQKNMIRMAHLGKPKDDAHKAKIRLAAAKYWIVRFPSGEEKPIHCLKKFCVEHGLRYPAMHRVACGGMKSHRGFSCRRSSKS